MCCFTMIYRIHLIICCPFLITCDRIRIYPMTLVYANVTWACVHACECVCSGCVTGPHGRAVFVLNGFYPVIIYLKKIYVYICKALIYQLISYIVWWIVLRHYVGFFVADNADWLTRCILLSWVLIELQDRFINLAVNNHKIDFVVYFYV